MEGGLPVNLPLLRHATEEPSLLFVYGTLRRRFKHPMARRLALSARHIGIGRLNGRLYHLSRYPGLIFSHRPDEWVWGDLYELQDKPGLLARLDRYEGVTSGRKRVSEYERLIATIYIEDATIRQAWVYCYQQPVNRLRRLVSGDFLRQSRRSPVR